MSKRDVLLLKFFIAVVVGGLIWFFGIFNLSDSLNRLRMERDQAQREIAAFDQEVGLIVTLNQRIPKYNALIESIAREYTRDVDQGEYILFLKSLLDESGILWESFTVTPPRELPIFGRGHDIADRMFFNAIDVMGYNSYRLMLHATNEQFLTFLGLKEDSGRGFASSNLVITSREDEYLLEINMELRFFYFANMEDLTRDFDVSEILDNTLFMEERRSVFQ